MTAFILDLDGTLYWDGVVLQGARETVAELETRGHTVVYCTNDATRSSREHSDRLRRLGFPVSDGQLISTSSATAQLLAQLPTRPLRVMVVGAPSLATEIAGACSGAVIVEEAPADAVVVGLDVDFSYARLARAQLAVTSGARLIATNADPRYPDAHGVLRPGAGAIVAAVETATGRRAELVGKPGPTLYRAALAYAAAEPERTAAVGDSTADIEAARALGLVSILVLSGVTASADDAGAAKADVVIDSIGDLLDELERMRPDLLLAPQREAAAPPQVALRTLSVSPRP